MNLFLLNSVHKPLTVSCDKNLLKNMDSKRLTKHIKQIEQRKIENFKRSVSFFKDMATQDAKFFQSIHDNIVKEFEEVDITSIVPFNKTPEVTQKETVEDIFDN